MRTLFFNSLTRRIALACVFTSTIFLWPLRTRAGALSGIYEVIASASTVNLTVEGTIDWAHWGRAAPEDFNHRAGVTQQISNFTVIGDGSVLQFGDNFTGYSWTNGAPIARATRTTSGIYRENEGNGFEISVPADTTVKTLKVYVGAYAAQMHFEASLSDNSAPPYLDESFENESDGPNRAYVLSFAANSAGQKLVVRYWVMSSGGGNVTLQAAALREGAPLVELIKPVNGSIFHPVSEGLQFKVSTISPNTVPTNGIKLFLNAQDVSTNLSFSGPAASLTASLEQLEANRFYEGLIIASDQAGQATTNRFVFDTFSATGTVVIEAEDYNYSEDGSNGGLFKDNSAPDAYRDLSGVADIDYHTAGQGVSQYRSSDAIATTEATDQLRPLWVSASAPDYDVTDLQAGDWLNYTRTFPQGNYTVYLRYAALVDQTLQLDQLTSDAGRPNQTFKTVGTIHATRTGNENSYRYAPMTDALGNPIILNASAKQTFRLTTVSVEPGFNGLQANFLLFAPATGPASRLPTIDSAFPAPDADEVAPDTRLVIMIRNGDTAVLPASIGLTLDGTNVTSSTTISANTNGASITYQPLDLLALNSTHTVSIVHGNDANPTVLQTNQWSFTVANLPVLQAVWSTAPGTGRTNGFLIKIAKASNDSDATLFTNSAARAELQLQGNLIDSATGQPFANEVGGEPGDGTYVETGPLNYEQDGVEAGYFPGDNTFPGIDAGDPNFIAMQVRFYLDLPAGLQRLGVRSDDGFVLSTGISLTNAILELGRFEGGRGSALPDGSTEFEFLVEKAGVYPFQLIWYEGTGGADLELFSVDRASLSSGNVLRALMNDDPASNAKSMKAFVDRTGTPAANPTPPTIQSVSLAGANLTFAFPTEAGVSYTVESKTRISDSAWQIALPATVGDGTVKRVEIPASGESGFYRINAMDLRVRIEIP